MTMTLEQKAESKADQTHRRRIYNAHFKAYQDQRDAAIKAAIAPHEPLYRAAVERTKALEAERTRAEEEVKDQIKALQQ